MVSLTVEATTTGLGAPTISEDGGTDGLRLGNQVATQPALG